MNDDDSHDKYEYGDEDDNDDDDGNDDYHYDDGDDKCIDGICNDIDDNHYDRDHKGTDDGDDKDDGGSDDDDDDDVSIATTINLTCECNPTLNKCL